MIRILTVGPNDYKAWLTYEGEYLNDAFRTDPEVELKSFGRFREGCEPDASLGSWISETYRGALPDLILLSVSLAQNKESLDRKVFEDLPALSRKTQVAFRVPDPWRFTDLLKDKLQDIQVSFVLTNSLGHAEAFRTLRNQNGEALDAYFFPYCVGRRYFNMGLDRPFDLALIGRCEMFPGNQVPPRAEEVHGKPFKRKGLKVFEQGKLSWIRKRLKPTRFVERYSELVLNLNQSLCSWNSPLITRDEGLFHTPLRYVEAAACGTLSVSPVHYPELDEFYFPPGLILCCDGDLEKAYSQVKFLRNHSEWSLEIQNRAYRWVLANHQGSNRVELIKAILKASRDQRRSLEARDFYGLSGATSGAIPQLPKELL